MLGVFYTRQSTLKYNQNTNVSDLSRSGKKIFTSFTIYDTAGYLVEGNSHINSYTWKPNSDGTITVHSNAKGKINNISSGGKEYNYIVRNYGATQDVINKKINPVKPEPVK